MSRLRRHISMGLALLLATGVLISAKKVNSALDVICGGKTKKKGHNGRHKKSSDLIKSAKKGYDYKVKGGQVYHWNKDKQCWYGNKMTILITVPKKSRGTVKLYFYDTNKSRTQEIVVEGKKPITLTEFGKGVWKTFSYDKSSSADGNIRIDIVKKKGANAVISKLQVFKQ